MNVKIRGRNRDVRTVTYNPTTNTVEMIEQRLLPHQFKQVRLPTYQDSAKAIRDMVVRGAGAIGATAAFGLAQGVTAYKGSQSSTTAFQKHVETVYRTLAEARPTAVDPVNAMNSILASMRQNPKTSIAEQQSIARTQAQVFADEDVEHCAQIGEHGASLIQDGTHVLTHCNAGWLAFVDIGTATAPMYAAQSQGRRFHVYCDETRPRCQGAMLTAWELHQQGISHQVIADNAAGLLFQRGDIDLVIVGSDRVLGRTGEVANKIGTYTKAVLARRHGIPFYVAIPLSTIDWNLTSGDLIPIEQRDASETLGAWGVTPAGKRSYIRIANPGSEAFNPGFDVTPAELITGIITPHGIFEPKKLWANRRHLDPQFSQPSPRIPKPRKATSR